MTDEFVNLYCRDLINTVVAVVDKNNTRKMFCCQRNSYKIKKI